MRLDFVIELGNRTAHDNSMTITVAIDETILREAERATNIHDWPTLVKKGLQALSQKGSQVRSMAFDFDRVLAAVAAFPDLSEAEFDKFQMEMKSPQPPPWSSCD